MTKSRIFWSIFMFLVLQNIVSLPFINKQCQIKSVFYFKQSNTFPILLLCLLNLFVLPKNFLVSGFCSFSLHLPFILNNNLSLILLIWIWVRGLEGNFLCIFMIYSNFEHLTLNKNRQEFTIFCLLSYIFPRIINIQLLKYTMFIRASYI